MLFVVISIVFFSSAGQRCKVQQPIEQTKALLAKPLLPDLEPLQSHARVWVPPPVEVLAILLLAVRCQTVGWQLADKFATQKVSLESARPRSVHFQCRSHGPPQTDIHVATTTIANGRRVALGLGLAAVATLASRLEAALAADEPMLKVYFGAGCFWHVQHELVGEEMAVLHRSASQITAVSGYAGGRQLGDGDKVCYHSRSNRLADYGKLGHAEVVQVEIPQSTLPRFAQKYFSLFGTRGFRHDLNDQGSEYRSVIGLPGGEFSPHFDIIKQAARESPGGLKLFRGIGDEPDTLGAKVVVFYDSNTFPFHPAEVYHQFHNDLVAMPYGKAYNDLQKIALERGAIAQTGCKEFRW